ncbi:MAG: hypothetical protein Q9205_003099 [Flavoplaca limonia]
MKVYSYFTTALGIWATFPESGIAQSFPPWPLDLDPDDTKCRATSLGDPSGETQDQAVNAIEPRSLHFCKDFEDYFDKTPEKWSESGAGDRYINFIKNHTDGSTGDPFGGFSEPSFFALKILGYKDFHCDVTNKGCAIRLSCDQVLTLTCGNIDRARFVYFIMESMHIFTMVPAVVAEQSVAAQTDLALMAPSMAHTFLWKQEEPDDRKCKLLAGIIKALITAALAVVTAAVAPAAIPAVAGIEAGVANAAAKSAVVAARASPWRFVTNAATSVSQYWKSSGAKQAEIGLGIFGNFPVNVGGDAIERAVCKEVPSAPENYESESLIKIQNMINNQMQDYRSLIDKTNADVLSGVGFGTDGAIEAGDDTMLAQMIQYGDYLDLDHSQTRRFMAEPSLIEQEIKNQFKLALISVILEEQMCYIQCSGFVPDSTDDTYFVTSDGRHCEAKCWQNWEGDKKIKLFGLDKIVQDHNEWNITISEFLKASYEHRKLNGIGNGPMMPSVRDVLEGTGTSTSEDKNRHPCMCGDDQGSETLAFWKEAHFDTWVGEKDKDNPFSAAKRMCVLSLAGETPLLPVPYFQNTCNMDLHWPTDIEISWPCTGLDCEPIYIQEGQDKLCPDFNDAIASIESPPEYNDLQRRLDVNCQMCFHNPVTQNIIDSYTRGRKYHDERFSIGSVCDKFYKWAGFPKHIFGDNWHADRCSLD